MAKRFTDTDIWDKEWFMNLDPTLKCLVNYVRDKCNLAGVWHPNYKLASTYIGETVNENILLSIDDGKQFLKLDCGKVFCIGFINFQYGENLNEKSPVHKKIIDILNKHFYKSNSLFDTVFNRVLNTLQEEEKEKEEEKEEVKDFGKHENFFDESALLPKMAKVFKEKNSNYTEDYAYDLPALKQIAHFICKQTGISFQPRDGDVQKIVLENWEIMSQWISEHKLYSNHNLQQINRYKQSISTEIKNGKSGNREKTTAGPNEKAGPGLEQKFNEFHNKGRTFANTA